MSARKLSTKEKCKRQKDAERLEKLRLLVSYLKSGSSQPMVSPVALEADEIELAERYKLHMILRDDLLRADGLPANGDDHQPGQTHRSPSSSTGNTSGVADGASSTGGEQVKSLSLVDSENAISSGKQMCADHLVMSRSIGGTTSSSPASSSCNSMNHAHSTNDARSNPHIGTVSWVLRHSISDPGNNFEHSPAFSSSSSSHHHHTLHNHHHHRHKLDKRQSPKPHEMSFGSGGHAGDVAGSRPITESECAQCESCAPSSSSYSGISLNNYCSAPTINKEAPGSGGGRQLPTSNEQKSPKLFYIDDLDHIPSAPTGMGAATAPFHNSGPLLLAPPSTPAVANNNSSQHQTSLPTALGSAASTATCCSQPVTPAIGAIGGDCLRNSSSASTSLWSKAPNLATWIDNEVNSLVHDLEAESQQLSIKSGSKKSKKKWLSVTSGHTRRNSSGAQST